MNIFENLIKINAEKDFDVISVIEKTMSIEKEIEEFESLAGFKFENDLKEWFTQLEKLDKPILGYVKSDQPMLVDFLPIKKAIEEYKLYLPFSKERYDEFFKIQEDELDDLDKRIKPFLVYEKWIPIAESSGSTLVFYDFSPTESGKIGQVIVYQHDPDFTYFVADNLTDFLKSTCELTLTHIEDNYEE
jgi:cell wall assembly regulator SMI1